MQTHLFARMNYYQDLGFYVSNSQLGELKKALYLTPERSKNLQDIFDFGNLVDAAVIEPEKLNRKKFTLTDESSGRVIKFNEVDWIKGMLMAESLDNDPTLNFIKKHSLGQYVFLRRKFPFTFSGWTVHLPTRCKLDLLSKKLSIALDIKTTSCSTQKSFIQSMDTFNYKRQGAFYMDMARVDKMWYFAVGKNKDHFGKYPVFKFAIKRGDDTYNKGKAEYDKLGFYYYNLVYKFDLPNTIILN